MIDQLPAEALCEPRSDLTAAATIEVGYGNRSHCQDAGCFGCQLSRHWWLRLHRGWRIRLLDMLLHIICALDTLPFQGSGRKAHPPFVVQSRDTVLSLRITLPPLSAA